MDPSFVAQPARLGSMLIRKLGMHSTSQELGRETLSLHDPQRHAEGRQLASFLDVIGIEDPRDGGNLALILSLDKHGHQTIRIPPAQIQRFAEAVTRLATFLTHHHPPIPAGH